MLISPTVNQTLFEQISLGQANQIFSHLHDQVVRDEHGLYLVISLIEDTSYFKRQVKISKPK